MTSEQADALLSAFSTLQATMESNSVALLSSLAEIYVLLCVMLGAFLAFALVLFFSHFFKH